MSDTCRKCCIGATFWELVKGGEHYKKGESFGGAGAVCVRLRSDERSNGKTAGAEQPKDEPTPRRATCEALDIADCLPLII